MKGAALGEHAAIAWIDGPGAEGTWGRPDTLALPLADRGLALADGLFETVLVADGAAPLLDHHLERWRAGAATLAMAPPPEREAVEGRLAEAIQRSGILQGALRLNWSRGCAGRGIDLPAAAATQPRFWLQLSPWRPAFQPVRVIISRQERRQPSSLLSRCKTFAYGWAVQARREAQQAGADDALLLSSDGQLCCGTTANLLLRLNGQWWTPPLSSGCLPGVMRGRALARGWLREAVLRPEDLAAREAGLLINSLDCRSLGPGGDGWTERLWRDCLESRHQVQQKF